MHSLETIKRLNDQSQDNWIAKQDQDRYRPIDNTEPRDQSFLVFSISQALGLASSNSEVSALLKVALSLAGKTKKA